MDVIAIGRDDDVNAALPRADFVSLHVPLTPQTHHLIDGAALEAIKPGAILVNTGRGQLVDQDALAAALRDGRLGAAALDVTDPEPLPAGEEAPPAALRAGRLGAAALDVTAPEPLPAGDPLLQAPNLLVVPHIGSATRTARARMADMAVDNLLAGLDGSALPHPAK